MVSPWAFALAVPAATTPPKSAAKVRTATMTILRMGVSLPTGLPVSPAGPEVSLGAVSMLPAPVRTRDPPMDGSPGRGPVPRSVDLRLHCGRSGQRAEHLVRRGVRVARAVDDVRGQPVDAVVVAQVAHPAT